MIEMGVFCVPATASRTGAGAGRPVVTALADAIVAGKRCIASRSGCVVLDGIGVEEIAGYAESTPARVDVIVDMSRTGKRWEKHRWERNRREQNRLELNRRDTDIWRN